MYEKHHEFLDEESFSKMNLFLQNDRELFKNENINVEEKRFFNFIQPQ